MTHALARVLVTGAQGFIGRWTTARLLATDGVERIVGIGRSERDDARFTHSVTRHGERVRAALPAGLRAAIEDARYQYRIADLRDTPALGAVIDELRPTAVVHLASHLRGDDVATLYGVNVIGTAHLLETIAACDGLCPRILLGSTGGVYGRVSEQDLPIRESSPCAPADSYAASKLAAETLARVLAEREALPLVIARIFNPIGVGLEERHLSAHLARQFAALSATDPTIRVGPLDTTRDLVHVEDVADALVALLERGAIGAAYNVASGEETTMQSVFDHLLDTSGRPNVAIERRTPRAGDIRRHVADISALQQIGAGPRRSWRAALDDLYRDYDAEDDAMTSMCLPRAAQQPRSEP